MKVQVACASSTFASLRAFLGSTSSKANNDAVGEIRGAAALL